MSLHDKILNLSGRHGEWEFAKGPASLGYHHGHRDARHAAAELASTQDALVAQLVEALEKISGHAPAYKGEYTADATLSDFGHNADDYAYEMEMIHNAKVGEIARAALAAARGEVGV